MASQMEYKANKTGGVHFFGNISKDFLLKEIDFRFELLHFIAALSLRQHIVINWGELPCASATERGYIKRRKTLTKPADLLLLLFIFLISENVFCISLQVNQFEKILVMSRHCHKVTAFFVYLVFKMNIMKSELEYGTYLARV